MTGEDTQHVGGGKQPRSRVNSLVVNKMQKAAVELDQEGNQGEGSNRQAVFDAEHHVIDGYYPCDTVHFIGVDLEDDKYLYSMTGSVQYVLTQHGLMYNSFLTDRFEGYREYTEPVEHDYIFHVVDASSWLPEEVLDP